MNVDPYQKALLDRSMAAAVDPTWIMKTSGMTPDPWQAGFLRSTGKRLLISAARQSGKSLSVATKAVWTALFKRGSLTLLVSKSQRQASELLRKVKQLHAPFLEAFPIRTASVLQFELENGSRILSLPSDEGTIRGFSGVALAVVDEASRVENDVFDAVTPTVSASGGTLVLLSTPAGRKGFFWSEWNSSDEWEKFKIEAPDCPRHSPEFLARERARMGERVYREEYLASFEADPEDTKNPRVFAGREALLDKVFGGPAAL